MNLKIEGVNVEKIVFFFIPKIFQGGLRTHKFFFPKTKRQNFLLIF